MKMTNTALNALTRAVDCIEDAVDGIKQETRLDPGYREIYLKSLERVLSDVEFIKGQYSLALQ